MDLAPCVGGGSAHEAIVVGSGFGGAVATCRLAQAGVDVGLLEGGRRFTPGSFPRHRTRPDLQHWRRGGLYDVRHLQDIMVVQGVGYGGGSFAVRQESHGGDSLEEVVIEGPMGESKLPADGMFVLIGAAPLTAPISDWLPLDDRGYVLTGRDLLQAQEPSRWPLERDPFHLETSRPGVFAAGDLRHGSIKRVASAVGEGAMAASLVHSFLPDGPV